MIQRFYLSSTFRDLRHERELIAEYLVKNEQLPVETVIASADPVLERCLADVERCDVMILLVASSYGTIVPGLDGVRRSVTHHEFLHARKKGLPILGFELRYLYPPDPLSEEQQQGLFILKRQMTAMERVVRPVFSKECLLGDVLTAVHKLLRDQQTSPFTAPAKDGAFCLPLPSQRAAPGAVSPAHQLPQPPVSEMVVQIQLQPVGDRFNLFPEVFLPRGDGGWQPWPEADPEPCDAVCAGHLANSLADLCDEAQRRLPRGRAGGIDQVVIELLLPTEVLADCLSQPREALHLGETLDHLRWLRWPCSLRSLERAVSRQQLPVWANQLRARFHHAGEKQARLLACSGWPATPSTTTGNAIDELGRFKTGLQPSDKAVAALVAVLACPDDRQHTGELLQALLASPLPVLLLWRRDGRDGADPARCWARANELLERQLPPLPEKALDPPRAAGCPLHPIHLPFEAWCSRAVAERRQHLVQNEQDWVHRAVLLLDCPERWPERRLPPPRPGSRPRGHLRQPRPSIS
jgi:hypothetical protein